eukprot:TRINITY_DN3478_c0_g1_i3.p1 TRINITY_DN3478_c0_g1~~TRINITY_DN3478_c0_g1_i3.p1  ORF type:complete len:350 (+),score=64.87 TRINITY_DN3478_c0_g1_i3:27-1076(+)
MMLARLGPSRLGYLRGSLQKLAAPCITSHAFPRYTFLPTYTHSQAARLPLSSPSSMFRKFSSLPRDKDVPGMGGSNASFYDTGSKDHDYESDSESDLVDEDGERRVQREDEGSSESDVSYSDDDIEGLDDNDFEFPAVDEDEDSSDEPQMSTYERSLQTAREMDLETNEAYDAKIELKDFPINNVLKMGFHTKITAGGRINSFSALVVVGTGTGTAGFGYGKGATGAKATARAYRDAQRNLVSMPRYKNITVGGSFTCKCRRSIIKVVAHGPYGEGRVHPKMSLFTEAFGLENVTVRSFKRRTWHNMLEAVMAKMPTIRTPEHIARNLGKRFTDLSRVHGARSVWANVN